MDNQPFTWLRRAVARVRPPGSASQPTAGAPRDDQADLDRSRRAFVGGSAAAILAATAGCSTDHRAKPPTAQPSPASSLPPTSTAAATPSPSDPPGPARFVASGPVDSGQVALTFHTNGDVALAHQLLDLLDARKVRTTAFVVGVWLDQHPDWAKRLVDGGHELANHTYSHPTFARLGRAQMADEISRCHDALRRTSGSGGTYFRPSGTANGTDAPHDDVLTAARAAGYATVLGYDVDPADYKDPGPDIVARRTIAALHPGAVISLHFGHAGTVGALPAILDAIGQRGLTAVTAGTLLAS